MSSKTQDEVAAWKASICHQNLHGLQIVQLWENADDGTRKEMSDALFCQKLDRVKAIASLIHLDVDQPIHFNIKKEKWIKYPLDDSLSFNELNDALRVVNINSQLRSWMPVLESFIHDGSTIMTQKQVQLWFKIVQRFTSNNNNNVSQHFQNQLIVKLFEIIFSATCSNVEECGVQCLITWDIDLSKLNQRSKTRILDNLLIWTQHITKVYSICYNINTFDRYVSHPRPKKYDTKRKKKRKKKSNNKKEISDSDCDTDDDIYECSLTNQKNDSKESDGSNDTNNSDNHIATVPVSKALQIVYKKCVMQLMQSIPKEWLFYNVHRFYNNMQIMQWFGNTINGLNDSQMNSLIFHLRMKSPNLNVSDTNATIMEDLAKRTTIPNANQSVPPPNKKRKPNVCDCL